MFVKCLIELKNERTSIAMHDKEGRPRREDSRNKESARRDFDLGLRRDKSPV